MSRPEIKNVRREQILDAFEVCVARFGVEGATLAKTAEQAGIARPLVRHNVGNRDELMDALVERFLQNSRSRMDAFIDALPNKRRIETAIDWLFCYDHTDAEFIRLSYALIVSSADNPALADKMNIWLNEFISALTDLIASEYPEADPEQVIAVATGITGIYFNAESLSTIGSLDALIAASKRSALILLASLESG